MEGMNNQSGNNAELRRRAEEIARTSENNKALSPEEMQRLVHELQIHQIELEMQNEELHRAHLELEASRAAYFDLYEMAPLGYCTINDNGIVQQANLTLALLLGVPRGALIGRPITPFLKPEDQDAYYLFCKSLFETDIPQTCESRMVKKDGTQFWAQLEGVLVQVPEKEKKGRVMISNINARKEAKNALCREKHQLEIMNSHMVGRELRMIELKAEVNALRQQLGLPKKYGGSTSETTGKLVDGL
jgi:PAS domain S-box-containing protein